MSHLTPLPPHHKAWYQATDVSEMLETFSRCNASDPWSWSQEFFKTSDRLERLAVESAEAGHHRSAGQYFLRAATYRRAALHRHPDPYHPEVPIQTQFAVDSFHKFLTEFEYPCKPVDMPYEDTTLPGYLCINPNIDGPAPTIMFQEGKDGWAEDGKFIVDEAIPRGYNVLLFDGPGIGKVMRLQGLPFRHDWENVITPLVDYLVELDEVDENNIALIAVSLGGYLGPRAAAYEHRLKALIANPGVMDWGKVYAEFLNEIDPTLMERLDTNPNEFDEVILGYMQMVPLMKWGMVDSQWHHNATTPSELMFEIRRFNNKNITKDIQASALIIDAEAETRGQSKELYESLVNTPKKEYVKFLASEAAELHVQPGATAILSARMFDFLDDIFANNEIKSFDASPSTRSDAIVAVMIGAIYLATSISLL